MAAPQDTATVTRLQTALSTLGFRLEITGNVDKNTAAAIADFQASMQLPATGEFDAETQEAIERLRHAWEGKDLPRAQ